MFPGVYAISDVDKRIYKGSHDPFFDIIKNPDSNLQYLVELYPFSETRSAKLQVVWTFPGVLALGDYNFAYAGGEIKERLSDRGFISKPTDSDPNRIFLGRVTNPLQFEANIISNNGFSGGNQSFGGVEIVNADGALDRFFNYHWSGRRVVVKAGGLNFDYDDFATIFEGTINNIEGDDGRIILTINDNSAKVDQPIKPGFYSGLGSINGSSAMAGEAKPLCFGMVKNIEPTLVQYSTLIYQVHDGSISSVDAVRDRGIPLTNAGDVADITTATPGPSEYVTQLSGGYIRLGSEPAGQITADVRGDNSGGFTADSVSIALKVVKRWLGVYSLSDADIEGGSFARLSTVLTGNAGIYINRDATGRDVLNALFNNSGAYWSFTRQGKLFAGAVLPPAGSTGGVERIDTEGLIVKDVIPPAWRIKVGYAPIGLVQNDDDLAGGVDDTTRTLVTQEYQYVTFEDSSIRLKNNASTEMVFNTVLADVDAANALLSRLMQIYGVKRMVFELTAYKTRYQYFLGDVKTLVYDRYGLNGGKDFVVVGVSDNASTGQTRLDFWG